MSSCFRPGPYCPWAALAVRVVAPAPWALRLKVLGVTVAPVATVVLAAALAAALWLWAVPVAKVVPVAMVVLAVLPSTVAPLASVASVEQAAWAAMAVP